MTESKKKWSRRAFLGASTASVATIGGLSLATSKSKFVQNLGMPTEQVEAKYMLSVCANCVNKCGLKVKIENGRVVKLNPNPHFPKSRSMLCAKGQAGVQVLYDKDRIKSPLIRTGPRGSGQFRKATWEEALSFTAENLSKIKEKYGPGGVLFASTEGLQEHFFRDFSAAFGSPNHVRHPSLCLASGNTGFFSVYGTVPGFDVANTKYMIFSGANRLESFITPDTIDLIDVIKNKKAKLIVLDPRYTVTASKADIWLPIKPGTDLAFYLALINVLITEELYDEKFVNKYTQGLEEVKEAVGKYTPEWAEGETEIPAKQIREIARELAFYAPRAFIYKGRRTSWYTNDTEMRQAMAIANALIGNWDQKGGIYPKQSIRKGELELDVWPPFPDQDCVVPMEEKHPLANAEDGAYLDFREKVMRDIPYPVRGFFVYKQNPMHSLPDRQRTIDMMKKMDFVAVCDIYPTDTAFYADVILPEDTYLERDDPIIGFQDPHPFLGIRQAVVPRLHDTKTGFEMFKDLSQRLGFPEFFDFTQDELITAQLKPFDLHKEDLIVTGVWTNQRETILGKTLKEGHRFPTPSGKIELASERFRRRGYDVVPNYRQPEEIPKDRFRLLVGKNAIFTHASNQNNPWLHELMPVNRLWIATTAAKKRRIEDGDWVKIISPVGTVKVQAYVTEKIRPDCVHLPHGFNHLSTMMTRAHGVGASDADLIITREDKITGNAALHETLVTVQRMEV